MQKVEIQVRVVGSDKVKGDLKSIESTVKSSSSGIASGVFTGVAAFSALSIGINAAVGMAEQFASAAIQVANKSLMMAAELEESRVAFDTMIGSGERAGAFLKELEQFALRTPFNLGDLQEQSKKLLAYGVSVDEMIPLIEDLGNIAAGVGREKLPQLTLAFGQTRAASKLTGMELRQFTEAGVPLLEELVKEMNKNGGAMTKVATGAKKTKVDVAELNDKLAVAKQRYAEASANAKTKQSTLMGLTNTIENLESKIAGASSTTAEFTTKTEKMTVAKLKEQMETDKITISYEQVRKALANLSGPGGRFEDLMDKQSKTLPGIISNLEDYRDRFFRLIGGIDSAGDTIEGGYMDKVKGVAEGIATLIQENGPLIEKFASGISSAMGTVVNTIVGLIKTIVTDEGVVGAFNEMKTAIMEAWAVITGDEDIKASLGNLKTNYIDFVVSALRGMLDIIKGIFTYIKDHPEEIQRFIDLLADTYKNAQSTWGALKKVYNFIKDIIEISRTFNVSNQIASLITTGKLYKPGGEQGGVFQAYAGGGVIPGPSTSGDRMTARVNSGEMIINKNQQDGLWKFIQGMSRPNVNFNGAVNFAGQRGERQQIDTFAKLLNMA